MNAHAISSHEQKGHTHLLAFKISLPKRRKYINVYIYIFFFEKRPIFKFHETIQGFKDVSCQLESIILNPQRIMFSRRTRRFNNEKKGFKKISLKKGHFALLKMLCLKIINLVSS